MRTIYTLMEPAKNHPELSGRLLYITVSKSTNKLSFYDAISNQFICDSAPILMESRRNNHRDASIRNLADEDNVIYSLIRLDSILPTTIQNDRPQLEVMAAKKIAKLSNRGDGYKGATYTFNRAIDISEFTEFIEREIGRKLRGYDPRYLDYDEISGSGPMWTYKEINPRTE